MKAINFILLGVASAIIGYFVTKELDKKTSEGF